MRSKVILGAGMLIAAALVQTGCSRENGSNQAIVAPERSAASGGGPSGSSPSSGTSAPAMNPLNPTAPRSANLLTLPEGTPLVVRTTSALSTKTQVAGQSFIAHLDQPVVLNGREVLGRGAELEGVVVESDKGGRVKGVATISVRMTRLTTPGGRAVDIATNTITHDANATKKKDAAKIGIGSGIGAAIGAIAGGGKGAAIGAAAGGGAGTGVVLGTHGDSADIPSESVLRFTLRSPAGIAGLR